MTNTTNAPSDALLVHAYLDGELDPANALALEQRIAADPALAAECARAEALKQALREKLPRKALPPGLRPRIEAAVGLGRARTGPSWRALAASVMLAVVLASGSTWYLVRPEPGDRIGEILDGHMRSLMATQPTDVTSSDRHTVKPWFNGRIPQAPRVIDLAQDDFPLLGGRIDVIGGTPVATLVYRHRQHVISLVAVPGGTVAARRALKGYNIVRWSEEGVAYWAVSDLGADDLEKFARLFQSAPADR